MVRQFQSQLFLLHIAILGSIHVTTTVTESVHNKTSVPVSKTLGYTSDNLSDHLNCSLKVSDDTAVYLADWISLLDGSFAHLQLNFEGISSVNWTSSVIFPFNWVWTYRSAKGAFRYLKWPFDYDMLSMGLLSGYTLRYPVKLDINVTPSNCPLTIGTHQTSQAIAYALGNMTKDFIIKSGKEYRYSYWCMLAEISEIRQTIWYRLGIHVGMPVQVVGYQCCRFKVLRSNEKLVTECFNSPIKQWKECNMIPYLIGIVLYAFFPLVIMKSASYGMRIGADADYAGSNRQGYQDIHSNNSSNISSIRVKKYFYLDGTFPVTYSKYILDVFGLVKTYPVLVSKFRRIMFIFLSPCIIYIQLGVYYMYKYEEVIKFVKFGVPIEFLSMLAGFWESKRVFLPYFGGPYIALIVYFICMVIVLITPSEADKVLVKGLTTTKSNHFLFNLDIHVLEKISMVKCTSLQGYIAINSLLCVHCYMVLNPKFWTFSIKFQTERWNRCTNSICRNTTLWILIKCPLLLIYAILCVFEVVLSVLYYGLPIIGFATCFIRGYNSHFYKSVKEKYLPLRLVAACVLTVCSLYSVIMFSIIFLSSFTFIGKILVFSYLSVIVFPNYAFGYLFFGGTFLFCIWENLNKLGHTYRHLLDQIVKASLQLQNEDKHFFSVSGLRSHHNTRSEIISQSSDEQSELFVEICSAENHTQTVPMDFIRYKDGQPGIPKTLFNYIVQREKPIHIQVFLSFIQIALVFAIVYASVLLVSHFNKTTPVTGVMQVAAVVFIGSLSHAIHLFFEEKDVKFTRKKLRRKIKVLIQEYLNEENSLYID